MITTDLNRAEFTGNNSSTDYVFASGGTNIPVKEASHIKVYLTNSGTFTADDSNETFTNVTLNGSSNTAHGHLNTEVIRVSAATSLPLGLLANTDYYVREKTSSTWKLETSVGAGVSAITSPGTGVLTWTKTLLKTITTDYTVTISGTTATVKFLVAPPTNVKILLIREVPYQQDTDLLNNSLIDAESLESQLDLIVNQVQQLKNTTERDIRFSDTLVASDATSAQAILNVTKADRANKGLKFDANGNATVSSIDLDKAEDYVLDSKSYATETGAVVNTYDGGTASPQSGVYSAKEYAIGTTATSAKDYATKTSAAVTGSEFSAKEYAHGSQAGTGGSSKNWASQVGADVTGGSSGDKSAKSWAQETGDNAPTDGSAKEWATTEDAFVTGSLASAKEYAQGDGNSDAIATGGSAKGWAQDTAKVNGATTNDRSAKAWSQGASMTGATLGGSSKDWAQLPVSTGTVNGSRYSSKAYAQSTTAGTDTYGGSAKGWASTAHGAAVPGAGADDRSALHYATDASNSATAAKNSAAAVSNTFDKFDDTYLGKMADNPSFTANASTDVITSNAHGLVDTQIIRLTGSDLPAGLSASTNYYVRDKTTNTFKLETSVGNGAIDITDAGSGTNTWYHGDVTTPANSTWTKNSSTITVASNIGIRVGQVVSGSGIPVDTDTKNRPNVVSIDGTSIVISENMAAASAGSGVAVTFASRGVYGQYNTTTKGPTTNNDGDALETGTLFFSSTANEMRILDSGGNWIAATSAGDVSLLEYKFVTTSAQVTSKTYSGTADVGGTLSYTADNIIVFMNGVQLKNGVDYTASNGSSVVLTTAGQLNDEINVLAFKSFTLSDMVSASSGGTFNGNVTHNGNIAMATNKKIQQKGSAFQSHITASLFLGA